MTAVAIEDATDSVRGAGGQPGGPCSLIPRLCDCSELSLCPCIKMVIATLEVVGFFSLPFSTPFLFSFSFKGRINYHILPCIMCCHV